jgi:hypothetical protein
VPGPVGGGGVVETPPASRVTTAAASAAAVRAGRISSRYRMRVPSPRGRPATYAASPARRSLTEIAIKPASRGAPRVGECRARVEGAVGRSVWRGLDIGLRLRPPAWSSGLPVARSAAARSPDRPRTVMTPSPRSGQLGQIDHISVTISGRSSAFQSQPKAAAPDPADRRGHFAQEETRPAVGGPAGESLWSWMSVRRGCGSHRPPTEHGSELAVAEEGPLAVFRRRGPDEIMVGEVAQSMSTRTAASFNRAGASSGAAIRKRVTGSDHPDRPEQARSHEAGCPRRRLRLSARDPAVASDVGSV